MNLSILCYFIAFALFVAAIFMPDSPRSKCVAAGLAFATMGVLLGTHLLGTHLTG